MHMEGEKLQESFINEWQYWIRELAIKVSEWMRFSYKIEGRGETAGNGYKKHSG